MSSDMPDLGVLSRAGRLESIPPDGPPPPGQATIPPPRRHWRTRVLLPAALLAGAAGVLAYGARDALRPATPVRVVPVVVRAAPASAEGPTAEGPTVQAPGWVEPDPYPVVVSALTDGVVKDVLVLEGQAVKAGDVVVRLVDEDARLALSRAEAELAGRQGDLGMAKAALEAARDDWDNPVERTRAVANCQAMCDEAAAELARLPVEVEAERARADELADVARRAEANVARRAVGESELVQARLRLKAQQALVASTAAKKPVLEARARQLMADLSAAKEGLRLRIPERKALDEAQAAMTKAEAALRQAAAARDEGALRLRRTEVRSPADGLVMARLVEPGSKLMLSGTEMRSAQVLRLYDPRRLQVRVDVPIADAARVGVGQSAKVVVGVLPDRAFDGVVTRVVQEADVQRNTLQVKVAIKHPSPELKPEMLTRVRFGPALATAAASLPPGAGGDGATSQQVFAPRRLLQRDGEGPRARAWVVDKGRGVATTRAVTTGGARLEGGWVAVASGLRAGDELISGDTSTLRDGTRVRVEGEDEAGDDAGTKGESRATH